MQPVDSHRLVRRFIELPPEKRRLFLEGIREEGIDFTVLPIPSLGGLADRDAASYAQRRMWFLWQLDRQSAAYNLPMAIRLTGILDQPALERAFALLVARHEPLRAVFRSLPDGSLQQMQGTQPICIETQEIDGLAEDEEVHRVAAEAESHALRPFDLEAGPLLHVKLLRLSAEEHVLLLCLHHIVADGWSLNILLEEINYLYDACVRGEKPDLLELPIQYCDYALWQRSWLEAGEMERQLTYWRSTLSDESPVLELCADHPRPAKSSFRGARHLFDIEAETTEGLRSLAKQHGATLFMTLLASFQALLYRYSGQTDIRVGVPIANRNRVETERLIGCFVNTQVLKADVNGQMLFSDLLRQVRHTALQAQAHQELPFEQLVEALQPQRSLSHHPLFQVMYNHQSNVAAVETLHPGSGLVLKRIEWQSRVTQFDLSLATQEQSDGLTAALVYATDLFDAETIATLARHWRRLLREIVWNPQQRISDLSLLSDEETLQLLEWNCALTGSPRECCIHELIEAQVEKTPDAVALVFGSDELTYRELDTRANRLAHRLIALGVGAEVSVGIAVDRSLEMMIGLLAILKAGGAYVPLDPEYPQERLAYMVEDSGVDLVLTQSALLGRLRLGEAVRTLCLDRHDSYTDETRKPIDRAYPENLAYVIYTSGSTGRPKGVAVAHRNTVALIHWSHQIYGESDLQGVLAATSLCFDLSVWELFVTLSGGGYAVLAANVLALPTLPARDRVRLINTVPSAIDTLWRSQGIPDSVRIVNLAGEPLQQSLVDTLYGRDSLHHVYDLYGPSEDTTYSTYARRERGGKANIGRPIGNTRCYLLGSALELAPVRVAAELYLGGSGTARGYHARPALTAERFIPNPFDASERGGGRLYRTGDLARYRPDGAIEYVGRLDHQVKIRGFRIELSEIEAKLLEQPMVREAAVMAQETPAGQQLVGYVVPAAEHALLFVVDDERGINEQRAYIDALQATLKSALPDHMVPAHIVLLKELPLAPNGKMNRKALPKPEAGQLRQTYIAPVTELEGRIAAIWAELLGVQRVGLTDNFFELGGHSLLATQVTARIQSELGVQISVATLFQANTLQAYAQSLAGCRQSSAADIDELRGLLTELEAV